MPWLPHPIFKVTKKAIGHDAFLLTGGKAAHGNAEPEVMEAYRAESPEKNSTLSAFKGTSKDYYYYSGYEVSATQCLLPSKFPLLMFILSPR